MTSITRVRKSPGGHDGYGDPVTSSSTEVDLDGWQIAPRYETQNNDLGRNGVIVGLTAYGPPGADLVHTDQVKVAGVLYDIEGEPGDWQGSQVGGVEVALRRAVG